MPTIEIDGVGRVELEDSFTSLAPEEQHKIIEEISGRGASSKAPDTSFGSAFQYGIDAPLENLGKTADALGYTGVGSTLKNLTEAPENYAPASEAFIAKGEKGFNWSELPRAVVEQGGNLAGQVVTRAGGAALGTAVAGPVGGAIGAIAAPTAFSALQTLGPVALERAKNNGREEPNAEDWQAAMATAGVSGALDTFGAGKLFKGGSLVQNTGRELATEGVQNVTEQVGSTAGTDVGVQVDPETALGGAIIGGGTAGSAHVAGKVANAPVAVGQAIRDRGTKADMEANPEQEASYLRTQKLYEDRAAAAENFGSKNAQDPDVIFKSVVDDLETNLKDVAAAYKDAGVLDKSQADIIKTAISVAKRHNREPGTDGGDVGYFDTEMDKVRHLGLDDQTTETLLNSLRDLNTASFSAFKKNKKGFFEGVGTKLGGPVMAAIGFGAAGPVGIGAGMVGTAIGKHTGRAWDRALGLQKPDVLRRAESRKRVADAMGLQVSDTVQGIKDVKASAQSKADTEKRRIQGLEAEFKKSRSDLRAKDIVAPGGFDKILHEQIGLKPKEVDKGLQELLRRGTIGQEVIDAFHDNPRDLMEGKQGLTLSNRLTELVHEGVLKQDDKWSPQNVQASQENLKKAHGPKEPVGSPVDALKARAHIRNPLAYEAAAQGSQARETVSYERVVNGNYPDGIKALAATLVGQTKAVRKVTLASYLKSLPVADRAAAKAALEPLTEFGKPEPRP
jgi:hypothetical protein